jgi:diguanylate cyclase (GGDEF)-like protein
LDRSGARTLLIAGARQLAALLPLLGLGALRLSPGTGDGTLPPWVEPALLGMAAGLAAAALVATVGAALRNGRARDLADAAALGTLAVTLGATLLAGQPLIGAGMAAGLSLSAVLFVAGSLGGQATLLGRNGRIAAGVAGCVAVEAALVLVLLAGAAPVTERLRPLLLLAPAVGYAVAAVTSGHAPLRVLALGLGATGSLVMSLAAAPLEPLVGVTAVGLAAAVLGGRATADLLRAEPEPLEAAPTPLLETRAAPEPTEAERLARELRGTIEELISARRTVELQRAEIERASAHDRLTGVASRGAILDRLAIETAEARRYEHPLAVVLLDVDGFAPFNHEHGVDAGDHLLREIALRLRLRIREADALGRIGADSFLAVLPHTDERGAVGFAEAVRERLAARPLSLDGVEVAITASLGVALMRPGGDFSTDDLLAAAEEALASAKAAGGNRIAFDRAHGLARLEERGEADQPPPAGAADATR